MFEHLKHHTPQMITDTKQKLSAVVIPLIKVHHSYHILFEIRAQSLNHQPGEICFPGGRMENNETLLETAYREAKEELLLKDSNLTIYGPLDYFVSPGHMKVQPFLGEIHNYHGQFSTDEVQDVFTVPLDFFKEHSEKIYHTDVTVSPRDDFPFELIPNGENYPWAKASYEVCFYNYHGHIIWGMTAKMLKNNLHYIV